MPNRALIQALATEIPAIVAHIDGVRDVEHRLAVEVSDEPIEDGALIQDHAEARSERLVLDIHVADLWADVVREETAGDFRRTEEEHQVRARGAWEALQRLHRDLEPVRVVTPWAEYEEMIITEAIGREVGRGGAKITLRLGRVLRVGVVEAGAVDPATASGPAATRPAETQRGFVRPTMRTVRLETTAGAEAPEGSASSLPIGTTDRSAEERVIGALPVSGALRQSFDSLAGGARFRLRTWWQASTGAWFAGLEFPPGRVLHAARRIAQDASIFPAVPGLGYRFVARALAAGATEEPGPDAWGRTHELRTEPA